MSQLERFGTGGIGDRHLYLVELATADALPTDLSLEGLHFACAILLDGNATNTDAIGRMAVSLLEQGLIYACTWGPGCERVHDNIDEELVGGGPEMPRFPLEVVTTWHANDSLDDALYYWLSITQPHDKYSESCTSSLVLSIGNAEWAACAREVVANPKGFCTGVLAAEANGV
jgi:hypothetical protein